MVPCPTRFLIPSMSALALLAAPALAQDRLTPGFWVFPSAPQSVQDVHELCMDGMTLIQSDDRWFSFLAEAHSSGDRLIIDAEAACTTTDTGTSCALNLYDEGGQMGESRLTNIYRRDTAKNLVMETTVQPSGAVIVSYPQMCPDSAVRDLLVGWLARRD